jgi:hypothetical protein
MADVAAEVAAGIPNLPPAQRREASIRAAALSNVANELLAEADGERPLPSNQQPPNLPV